MVVDDGYWYFAKCGKLFAEMKLQKNVDWPHEQLTLT